MNILCRLGIHKWEEYFSEWKDCARMPNPVRGCLRCDKVQVFGINMGLNFWHDFAPGWTYSNFKKYDAAETPRDKILALGGDVTELDRIHAHFEELRKNYESFFTQIETNSEKKADGSS